jgi:hypothetical protein
LGLVAVAWSLVVVATRGRVERGPVEGADSAGAKAAPPRTAPGLEEIGRFPAIRAVYDPHVPGRLHAGGEVSEDGGRTWRPLAGDDGRRVVPLGASRALAPALSPDGAVLYGEVLYDEPGVPRGLGRLAHGAEWRDGAWHALLPVDLAGFDALDEPRWRVTCVAYVRGRAVLATDDGLVTPAGAALLTPVRACAILASSDGATWVATDDPGRFPLYVDADGTGAWLPVAGASPVSALAEGGGGVSAAGQRLGRRGVDGTWRWWGSPVGRLEGIAAHPRLPLVAAWGPGGLVLSRSPVAGPSRVPTGTVEVAWAAWDPARDDALTLLDRRGFARRLSMASVR